MTKCGFCANQPPSPLWIWKPIPHSIIIFVYFAMLWGRDRIVYIHKHFFKELSQSVIFQFNYIDIIQFCTFFNLVIPLNIYVLASGLSSDGCLVRVNAMGQRHKLFHIVVSSTLQCFLLTRPYWWYITPRSICPQELTSCSWHKACLLRDALALLKAKSIVSSLINCFDEASLLQLFCR